MKLVLCPSRFCLVIDLARVDLVKVDFERVDLVKVGFKRVDLERLNKSHGLGAHDEFYSFDEKCKTLIPVLVYDVFTNQHTKTHYKG